MAVLGKRKAAPEPSVSQEDAAAIFRRHFEAQFAPLTGAESKRAKAQVDHDESNGAEEDEDDEDEDEEDDEEEWGGFSEGEFDSEEDGEEEAPVIEIVDHSKSQSSKITTMSRAELKAFMSSRPLDPTAVLSPTTTPTTTSKTSLPEDAPTLLAQDLELRRLLAESHLLAPAVTASGHTVAPKAFAAGRTRHKATDLRVQALGSNVSIHKQEKMPMNMRKGIVAAAGAREAKRRQEAKENGIILERETGKGKRKEKGRGGSFEDRPGVGRLRGAELRLSDRDIQGIEGSRDAFGRRGRR